MPEFMDRVMPVVDETIQAIEDPIGGAKGRIARRVLKAVSK